VPFQGTISSQIHMSFWSFLAWEARNDTLKAQNGHFGHFERF
jgi:hypothetical protein